MQGAQKLRSEAHLKGARERFTPLDIAYNHFPFGGQDFPSCPERWKFLSNGARLKRNAADGLFMKPSRLMISQKGQKRVIASEAKQSYVFYLIDFMRLLRRYASRNDTTPDFLPNHQDLVIKSWGFDRLR
jgi:hypothetical protein